MTRPAAELAPGVVKIRLSGGPADLNWMTALLAVYDGCGIEIIERSAPRRNRRDPGARVYLTVRVSTEAQR